MYETHYRRPKDLAEAAKLFADASEAEIHRRRPDAASRR